MQKAMKTGVSHFLSSSDKSLFWDMVQGLVGCDGKVNFLGLFSLHFSQGVAMFVATHFPCGRFSVRLWPEVWTVGCSCCVLELLFQSRNPESLSKSMQRKDGKYDTNTEIPLLLQMRADSLRVVGCFGWKTVNWSQAQCVFPRAPSPSLCKSLNLPEALVPRLYNGNDSVLPPVGLPRMWGVNETVPTEQGGWCQVQVCAPERWSLCRGAQASLLEKELHEGKGDIGPARHCVPSSYVRHVAGRQISVEGMDSFGLYFSV